MYIVALFISVFIGFTFFNPKQPTYILPYVIDHEWSIFLTILVTIVIYSFFLFIKELFDE